MRYFKNILLYLSILGVFALHPSLNKGETPLSYLHYLVYGNALKLKVDAGIDKNYITIKWFCTNFDSACNQLTIIDKGKKTNNIPFEIGKQELVVYYKNQIIGKIEQVKRVKKQAHSYHLELVVSEIKNAIKFKAFIQGPESVSVTTNLMTERIVYLNDNN